MFKMDLYCLKKQTPPKTYPVKVKGDPTNTDKGLNLFRKYMIKCLLN